MEYFKIGKLVGASGVHGQILLRHELGKKSSLKGLKAIFIEEQQNAFVPWFIESAKIKSENETYVKLEGIHTREDALKISRKDVWLPEEDFKKYAAKSSAANYLGYQIIDQGRSLGPVLEVIEQPHQLLCRLEMNQKEVLVPLNENTLNKIDHRNRQILVTLPEGLLAIYL
jgi:16S rRNA processing protein RimM